VEVISLYALVSQLLVSQGGEQVFPVRVLGLSVSTVGERLKFHVDLFHLSGLLVRHLDPYAHYQAQSSYHARPFPGES